ncbi:DUF3299 domain-containing protein [Chelativorans alearense]|uniref:DUF3299 domain-containing protein n=1 Tax=Chelativorans alearense TaxID=2681495 RepID=UPI0013D48629|nr:DUF3299 domain-containing protein [Chelativorans alearense]
MRVGVLFTVAIASLLLPATAGAESLKIGWRDLLPEGHAPLAPQKIRPTPSAKPRQIALSTAFDGKTVELSGHLLPADREGELVYAFMLVPRSGACSHMAQPPPSQVIRVVPEEPYRLSMNYEPVSVTGRLTAGLEKTQLFILDGVAVIESGYRMSMAQVTSADFAGGKARPATPWGFLGSPARD